MKNSRKRKPVYSTWKPPTSSVSATGMSNGVWVSSAWAEIMKIRKPMNWVRMNGLPMRPNPKISPSAWARTISCKLSESAWMTTPMTARISGSSYAMSWPAARRPPSKAYLLAEAQPAISTPSTDSDETAIA